MTGARMGDRPSLTIVIVNWNAGDQLRECIGSIPQALTADFTLDRLIVVDNASADGSADALAFGGLPLTVIRNRANRGFAAACNQAANSCTSDYVLFLNPDTQLFVESLTVPVTFLQKPENRDVGIAGIQLIGDDGGITRSCARLPSPGLFLNAILGLDRLFPTVCKVIEMRDWDHRESRDVGHVIGAFFMTRRTLFQALGGFDERFFVFWEDLDFSTRAHHAGWRTRYLTEAQAYHRGGGTSHRIKPQRLAYAMRSRTLLGYKHFSWGTATLLALGTLIVQPVVHLAATAGGRTRASLMEVATGYWLLWKSFTPRRRSSSERIRGS